MKRNLAVKSKAVRIIAAVCLVLNLMFIWGNSCIGRPQSQKVSDTVMYSVIEAIPSIGIKVAESESSIHMLSHIIRKCAHVTEFLMLAVWLSIIYSKWIDAVLRVIFSGIMVALIDETIQIFSGRGSTISDVWVDTIGVVIGTVVSFITMYIIQVVNDRKVKKEEQMDKKFTN